MYARCRGRCRVKSHADSGCSYDPLVRTHGVRGRVRIRGRGMGKSHADCCGSYEPLEITHGGGVWVWVGGVVRVGVWQGLDWG